MKKEPDRHTETLVPWAKSPLGRSFERDKFHVDPEDVRRSASKKETVDQEIQAAIDAVREILQTMGLPSEIADNHLYADFLLYEFPESGSTPDQKHPLNADRSILPLAPYHLDMEKVETRVDMITQRIFGHLEALHRAKKDREPLSEARAAKATRAIKNAVFMLLDQNIRRLDNSPTLQINPDSDDRISTRDLRAAVRRTREAIDSGTVNPEDADFKLLFDDKSNLTRHIDAEEFRTQEQLERALIAARNNAHKFYEQYIGESLLAAQLRFNIPGERIAIDIDERNKEKGLFELLDTVINNPNEEALRTLNEAQALAYLTYRFFIVKLNHAYRAARTILQRTRRQTRTHLFVEDQPLKEVTIYYDKKNNVVPYKTPSHERVSLRTLNIEGFEDLGTQHAFYTGWSIKAANSIVAKLMERPESHIENLPDLLRGTTVAWDIGNDEIDHPDEAKQTRYRDYLNAIAHKVGESLGLEFNPETQSYLNLLPGQYFISVKLDGNPNDKSAPTFRVVKMYGITAEGVPVEHQIHTRDTYLDKKSNQSPNHDKYYQWEKAVKLTPLLHAASINPRAHEVAKLAGAAIKHSKLTMGGKLEAARDRNHSKKRKGRKKTRRSKTGRR